MRIKFLVFLFVAMIISLGCIESRKIPVDNLTPSLHETRVPTPETPIFTPKQGLPYNNETKPLKINDTFETWSRGYDSNKSYMQAYFRVITNYSSWVAFLNEQGYFAEPSGLEGTLFPGLGVKPKTIEPADFNENFIIAAMMGRRGYTQPKIEIINISRINNTVNITVSMYESRAGDLVTSWPYHIVIVKRELLPAGNSTFVFIDTEDKRLGRVQVKE